MQSSENGFVTLEITLSLLLIAFLIMAFIGMGHAIITRHHALVAARFAAYSKTFNDTTPSAETISNAVSMGKEHEWEIIAEDQSGGQELLSALNVGDGTGIVDKIAGAISQDSMIKRTVRTRIQRGMFVQYNLNQAKAEYYLANNTWERDGCSGLVGAIESVFGVLGSLLKIED